MRATSYSKHCKHSPLSRNAPNFQGKARILLQGEKTFSCVTCDVKFSHVSLQKIIVKSSASVTKSPQIAALLFAQNSARSHNFPFVITTSSFAEIVHAEDERREPPRAHGGEMRETFFSVATIAASQCKNLSLGFAAFYDCFRIYTAQNAFMQRPLFSDGSDSVAARGFEL